MLGMISGDSDVLLLESITSSVFLVSENVRQRKRRNDAANEICQLGDPAELRAMSLAVC